MWAAGGGGFIALAIIGMLIRAGIRGAERTRAHQRAYQVAERRHQETLAAIRTRAPAPAVRQPPAVLPRMAVRPRAGAPQDALPEAAVVEAAGLVIGAQYATFTFLQRRMRIAPATSGRLMAILAVRGVVGPPAPGAKLWPVLVKPGDWEQLRKEWAAEHGAP